MAQLFVSPFLPAFNNLGAVAPGATLTFYLSGTSTEADIFSSDTLETELSNPVVADSAGRFPPIFLSPDISYRVVLATASGAIIDEVDPLATSASFLRPSGTNRSLQSKLSDRFDLRDFGVRSRFATANEYTSEIQAALNQAKAEGVTAVYCAESYRVTGTLVQPASVAIVSDAGVSRWFEGSPAGETAGPGFYKPSDGLDGTLLIRGVGAHLIGISLDHQKVGGATPFFGGVMQMGPGSSSSNFNNTLTMNCHLRGHEINESTGLRRGTVNFAGEFGVAGTDCTLVHWPASTLGFQRYWHIFSNIYLENARRGFNMGDQSNANFTSGLRFRSVYRPVWMTGGGFECIENVFDGIWSQNYALPTPTQTGAAVAALPEVDQNAAQADIALITMQDACRFNVFRGPTEAGGRLWYLSPESAAAFNDASGLVNNERFQSPMPIGWALPKNEFDAGRRSFGGKREKFVPLSLTTTDGHVQGHGARIDLDHVQTTGLPLMNGSSGAPTTGTASRIMAKWTTPITVAKAAAPHIRLKTEIVVHAAGGGSGSHSTEIEWEYRVSNNTGNAGELRIISWTQFPSVNNYVVGCHFITGETGGDRPFAIALTLGNFGAVAPTQVGISLLGKIQSTNATPRPMAEFGDVDFTPTALTTNDVTDAVSMLAAGVTAI